MILEKIISLDNFFIFGFIEQDHCENIKHP